MSTTKTIFIVIMLIIFVFLALGLFAFQSGRMAHSGISQQFYDNSTWAEVAAEIFLIFLAVMITILFADNMREDKVKKYKQYMASQGYSGGYSGNLGGYGGDQSLSSGLDEVNDNITGINNAIQSGQNLYANSQNTYANGQNLYKTFFGSGAKNAGGILSEAEALAPEALEAGEAAAPFLI